MKAIWNGSIAFGLINIPIRVCPASEDHALEFHMLHKKDLSPVRFARICKDENNEIPYSEIVKGYEYEKGQFIVVDDADFKAASAKKTSSIDLQYFTEVDQIDPIYYEKPYFLEPEKKSGKAYRLLWESLLKSKKVAIGNFVFRNREHIGVIIALKEGLLLIQMRYHAEIRPFEELNLPKEKSTPQELKMALTLIDELTQPFTPEKHHDTYVEELMKVIETKAKGKKVPVKTKAAKPAHEARDLMYLLQESMKKAVGGASSKKTKAAPSRTKAPAKHSRKQKK